MDSTVRTTVLIVTVVVIVLVVLLIIRQVVLKNKRVNRRDDSRSHSSVIDALQASGLSGSTSSSSSDSSSSDHGRHHVHAANAQQPPAPTGNPIQFQRGPQVQAHQAINTQRLVGTANVVQPTCPGGCGAGQQQPSAHQVHAPNQGQEHHHSQGHHLAKQGQDEKKNEEADGQEREEEEGVVLEEQPQIHQPSQVPNYGPRMAQRRPARRSEEAQTQYAKGPKEHFQQWVHGNNGTQEDDEKQYDSPRPKASRFVSKNSDD